MSVGFPALRTVVIDATNAREVAEFWRQLLGYLYRPGDECPPPGQPDLKGEDWLVLTDREGQPRLAVAARRRAGNVDLACPEIPQQLHLDLTVPDVEVLTAQRDRALSLGAEVLQDRSTDPDEPLYVFADPAGHPFCIFVSPDHSG